MAVTGEQREHKFGIGLVLIGVALFDDETLG